MATFILVHGGGHGGWCWDYAAAILRKKGHHVHCPTLTGVGDKLHLATTETTLETHIHDVTSLIWQEDLEDVVLVGHSYGGMVITGVADAAPDRISHLVYLDAAIPRDGEALIDVSPGLQFFNDVREVDGVRFGLWPNRDLVTTLYGIDDAALADRAMEKLTPHPWATFEAKIRLANDLATSQIPRAVINCSATLARRPEALRQRWLEGSVVVEIDAGHDVMVTEPQKVADMLMEIAATQAGY